MTPNLRPYNPDLDSRLVLNSWTNQVRGCPPLCEMSWSEFNILHRPLQLALIDRVPPLMATSPSEPGLCYGYICGELLGGDPDMQVLHMLYVRNGPGGIYRRRGVATTLMRSCFPNLGKKSIYVTHRTRAARHVADKWRLRFNPYLAQVNS